MQTVNFQCGHCGNLMAVGIDYLGQQLRCPTCQQVVLAPADAFPPPAPGSPVDTNTDGEAIVTLPQEVNQHPVGSEALPLPDMPGTVHESPPVEPVPNPSADGVVAPEPVTAIQPFNPTPAPTPWLDPAPPTDTGTPIESPLGVVRKPRDYSGRVNWFVPLVFIPLVLYAVLTTAIAGYLYLKLRTQPVNPFDRFPDWEGDTPGVRKEKPKLSYDRKFATQPLPPDLIVRLGETLRIGDLEVTPRKVERRKIELIAEGKQARPEPSPTDALVLHLHLKNVAEDYAFSPIDNFFDRHWKPGNDGSPPLTLLQAGDETFFGGPAKWHPTTGGQKTRREWLVGPGRRNLDREGLAPNHERETIVATDAWDVAVAHLLFGVDEEGNAVKKPYAGKLLWRVQVRRGLIDWKGRMLPATAVIGVEFSDADYAG